MRRVREYRYIVREMMQADLERHDGIDRWLAFSPSSYGSIKEKSADQLLAYLDEGPWDGTVRTYLKGIFPLQFRFIRGRRKPQRRRRHGHPGITATLSGPFVYGNTGRVTALAGHLLQLQDGDKAADLCSGLGISPWHRVKPFPRLPVWR